MNVSWKKYILATQDRPPRPLLVAALRHVVHRGSALDLGAGALMDSKYLLAQGFNQVVAVDADDTSEEIARHIKSDGFAFYKRRVEDYTFPSNTFDLVNAQRVLPYLSSQNFDSVVKDMLASLKHGGIFSGIFFGERDQSILPHVAMTRPTKAQLLKLFSQTHIITCEESEEDRESTLGTPKHFHEISLVIQK